MNERDDTFVDANEIDQLNAAWDDWTLSDPIPVGNGHQFDALFAALESTDRHPDPDHIFLTHLRSQLTGSHTIKTPAAVPKSAIGLVAFPQSTLIFPRSNTGRFLVAATAAMLLIAALFGGSHWIPGSDSAGLVASAMASPATHEVATSTIYPASSSKREPRDSVSINSSRSQDVVKPTVVPTLTVPIRTETFGDHLVGAVRTPAVVYSRE